MDQYSNYIGLILDGRYEKKRLVGIGGMAMVFEANDLLRKITDETTATLNRSTHEIELLQAKYNLKNILNR